MLNKYSLIYYLSYHNHLPFINIIIYIRLINCILLTYFKQIFLNIYFIYIFAV